MSLTQHDNSASPHSHIQTPSGSLTHQARLLPPPSSSALQHSTPTATATSSSLDSTPILVFPSVSALHIATSRPYLTSYFGLVTLCMVWVVLCHVNFLILGWGEINPNALDSESVEERIKVNGWSLLTVTPWLTERALFSLGLIYSLLLVTRTYAEDCQGGKSAGWSGDETRSPSSWTGRLLTPSTRFGVWWPALLLWIPGLVINILQDEHQRSMPLFVFSFVVMVIQALWLLRCVHASLFFPSTRVHSVHPRWLLLLSGH
jgi:hypothetical protein